MVIKTGSASHEVFSIKDIRALANYKEFRKRLPKNATYVGLRSSRMSNGKYVIDMAIHQHESMYTISLAISEEDPTKIGIKPKRILEPIEIGDSC